MLLCSQQPESLVRCHPGPAADPPAPMPLCHPRLAPATLNTSPAQPARPIFETRVASSSPWLLSTNTLIWVTAGQRASGAFGGLVKGRPRADIKRQGTPSAAS
jgi:hypothetical protein